MAQPREHPAVLVHVGAVVRGGVVHVQKHARGQDGRVGSAREDRADEVRVERAEGDGADRGGRIRIALEGRVRNVVAAVS